MEGGEEMNSKWTVELEVALFRSMTGHKPVGLNKHFHMLCIQNKFHQLTGVAFSTETLWRHLGKLYDLEALDEFERPPFSLEDKQEFELPPTIMPVGPSPLGSYFDEGESTPSSTGGRKRGRGSCTPTESPSSSPVRTTKRRRL